LSLKKIYIDGDSGTTGLEIVNRLEHRKDLEVLPVDPLLRKDPAYKLSLAKQADLVVLCLPDQAAREAVSLYGDADTKILDASSAHRTEPGWVYGMPEIGLREQIKQAQKVSNPGCYPTGFILAIEPLVRAGVLSNDDFVTVNAVSGYSGGGRQLIEEYEENKKPEWAVRLYGLGLDHKHLPEMHRYSGLNKAPLFVPSVGDFKQGMLVSIPLEVEPSEVMAIWYKAYQEEPFVEVLQTPQAQLEGGFLSATQQNGTNQVQLSCFGNGDRAVLVARLDNLGKGASGAAVQNLNLMLGLEEGIGLV